MFGFDVEAGGIIWQREQNQRRCFESGHVPSGLPAWSSRFSTFSWSRTGLDQVEVTPFGAGFNGKLSSHVCRLPRYPKNMGQRMGLGSVGECHWIQNGEPRGIASWLHWPKSHQPKAGVKETSDSRIRWFASLCLKILDERNGMFGIFEGGLQPSCLPHTNRP